jgi:hypothetical protein
MSSHNYITNEGSHSHSKWAAAIHHLFSLQLSSISQRIFQDKRTYVACRDGVRNKLLINPV